jgi:GAF domain-containing protein
MLKNKMPIDIHKKTLEKWQQIVDVMAEIMDIPAGLIMRVDDSHIEVFVASKSEGNPYHPGDKEEVWGSGLYCETVIKNKDKLLVPNALKDENWKNNPDIKLNMLSYLGLPVLLPDGKPFGTICVLDNKENAYSSGFEKLLSNFRDLIQLDLEIIYMNKVLA